MARITARQAFAKVRAKRRGINGNKNNETTSTHIPSPIEEYAQVLVKARKKYNRRVSRLNTMANDNVDNSNNNNIAEIQQQSTDPMAQSNRTPRRVSARAKAIAESNRKITDYYQILSKSREDYYQQVEENSRARKSSLRPRLASVSSTILRCSSGSTSEPEVITLSDSDDDNDKNSEETDLIHHFTPTIQSTTTTNPTTKHFKLEFTFEANNQSPSPTTMINHSFNDLKIGGQVDEDIEIVDILPPIPLRDHPVFEIEDD